MKKVCDYFMESILVLNSLGVNSAEILCGFLHGSYVYGLSHENSDIDIVFVVDDCVKEKYTGWTDGVIEFEKDVYDIQVVLVSEFTGMIKKQHIIFLESLWLSDELYYNKDNYDKLVANFVLDPWTLRCVISSIVNNSYAKCHKKLTVKKDYDPYRAKKSLFHCIRLYMFGLQIMKAGKIMDYAEANGYYDEIINNPCNSWEVYKHTYKPILNALHSEFVKLIPKTKETL